MCLSIYAIYFYKLYTDGATSSIYRRRVIQQAIFEELCEMLNPGKKPYTPKKGKPNVIMFVGLQVCQC